MWFVSLSLGRGACNHFNARLGGSMFTLGYFPCLILCGFSNVWFMLRSVNETWIIDRLLSSAVMQDLKEKMDFRKVLSVQVLESRLDS